MNFRQAGHVSVMVNLTSASYDGGVHGYLMIRLNILIMNQMMGDFPRIDKRAVAIKACTK